MSEKNCLNDIPARIAQASFNPIRHVINFPKGRAITKSLCKGSVLIFCSGERPRTTEGILEQRDILAYTDMTFKATRQGHLKGRSCPIQVTIIRPGFTTFAKLVPLDYSFHHILSVGHYGCDINLVSLQITSGGDFILDSADLCIPEAYFLEDPNTHIEDAIAYGLGISRVNPKDFKW